MNKIGAEKREFIRLDSAFPVEFSLLNPDGVEDNHYRCGFTRNISKSGICLEGVDPGEHFLSLAKESNPLKARLRIHIPLFLPAVIATASVAWVRCEQEDCLGGYNIGFKYEDIRCGDKKRIMNFVVFRMFLHRFAVPAIIVLLLIIFSSFYLNSWLLSRNKRLTQEMASVLRDSSLSRNALERLTREKDAFGKRLSKADLKIRSISQELVIVKESPKPLPAVIVKAPQDGQVSAFELSNAQAITKLEAMLLVAEKEKMLLSLKLGALEKKKEAVSTKLKKEEEKMLILEKKNFEKMYQWLKIHQNPRTGLLSSFEGDRELDDQAFTYDQALAVIAFSYFKDFDLAKKILNFYQAKAKSKEGYYNSYYTSVGEPAEFVVHCGPNLWLGIAALQYTGMSGDQKYLPLAKTIAGAILKIQYQDAGRGLRGGPEVSWYSTEHNLDGVAFFRMLYALTKENVYKQAADDLEKWLKINAYDNKDIPIKRGKGDATIATDTYAWSIAALGPGKLVEMGMNPEEIMQFAEDNCSVTVDYTLVSGKPEGSGWATDSPTQENIKVLGFDFAKNLNLARGGVISTEWTAQMVLSYKILSRYFGASGEKEKENIYRAKADKYLEELLKLVITSPSRTGQGQGCLPYASTDYVNTGHGWMTPKGKNTGSVSGTAYTIFAYYGFNPLEF